ncbi:MAG: hypothetical protein QG670_540 [Thermoproteota archaeon]|nr:hypothetical protein [Thermoproteota archaeon]
MVLVKVEFMGTLRGAVGKKSYEVIVDEPVTVGRLLKKLNTSLNLKKNVLFNRESLTPRSEILILVDGKEISILNGFATKLTNESQVTLIPVSHGG